VFIVWQRLQVKLIKIAEMEASKSSFLSGKDFKSVVQKQNKQRLQVKFLINSYFGEVKIDG
jgi:hypothetical protein